MILIPIKTNEGLVTINVKVKGTETWAYLYDEDQMHTNSPVDGKPLHHTLGQPFELKDDVHYWEFRIANPFDRKINVDVEIDWIQDEKVIKKWNQHVTVSKESAELIYDNGLISKILAV